MKAVQYTDHGGPEVVEYGELPDPEPGRGEALVDVRAGALNHLDLWTRRGLTGFDLDLPPFPAATPPARWSRPALGRLASSPAIASRSPPGSRRARILPPRGGADVRPLPHHRRAHARDPLGVRRDPRGEPRPFPDGVDWEVAAVAPLVFGTAWRLRGERGDVRPGERVLVPGASGGVGHAAVQIARHAGARVIATASTEEKREYARELGAERALGHDDGSADEIRSLTDRRGVDVVVDHVGEETWPESLRALAKGGRLRTCGATTGPTGETDIRRVFWNQLTVIGSTMAAPGELDDVLSLVWNGTLEPRIRATLPMSETARGHELLENREGDGKVVVIPDDEL